MSEQGGIKARLVSETKLTLVVFVYLAVLLSAFTTYRRLLLAEYGIPYFHYGCSLIEAAVLAKVIVVGNFLRLGEGFVRSPLIIPTLYKTLWFSALVMAFKILEEVLIGWWEGQNFSSLLGGVFTEGLAEKLARVVILYTALAPMFAVWETGRVLGEGKLFEMFFHRRPASPKEV